MKKKSKPYLVAQIAYDPSKPKSPWFIIRHGTIAAQGGYDVGVESQHYSSLEGACAWLAERLEKDQQLFNILIEEKEDASTVSKD